MSVMDAGINTVQYSPRGREIAAGAIKEMKEAPESVKKREILKDSFVRMGADGETSGDEKKLADLALKVNGGNMLPKEGANALLAFASAVSFALAGTVGDVTAKICCKSAESTFLSLSKTHILNEGFIDLLENPKVPKDQKEVALKGLEITEGVLHTGFEGENPLVMDEMDVAYYKTRAMSRIAGNPLP
jgi:hypothetical protein